jgi:GNAT superfamily N-acetyltransferase
LSVRPASLDGDDAEFILAAWDSTLPFLASIGAGEMWGNQPFSQREGQRQEIIDIINGTTKEVDGGRQFWIAEIHGAEEVVRVAVAMTREVLPGYLTKHVDMGSHIEANKTLLYLEVLIADQRLNKRHRGAGRALIEALEQRARLDGKYGPYVDVWAGNDRRLNTQVWPAAEEDKN